MCRMGAVKCVYARHTCEHRRKSGINIDTINPGTCVGMMCVMSSSESFLRIVVLPALSKPSTKIRASWSLLLSLRSNVNRPI